MIAIIIVCSFATGWFLGSADSVARELRKMNQREERRDKEKIYGKDAAL
jgi:hypothetical protein